MMAKVLNIVAGISIKLFLTAFSLIYIIPLLIILTNSLMSMGEITRHYGDAFDAFDHAHIGQMSYVQYRLIPEMISFSQYYTLLFRTPVYLDHFMNSVRLTLPIIAMHLSVGTLAAYGFTVWQSKFKEIIFCAYIVVMVLPFQATLVPNFIMADTLGILNAHSSIILPLGFSPFAVFIMRQSMKGTPPSILEAAQIDGANHWKRFLHIALPMSKSGVAALVMLTFADSWAMIEHPMVFLRDSALEPLSVVLYRIGQENMGLIFAASVFYMLPMMWLFLYGQECFEQGVKLSALK